MKALSNSSSWSVGSFPGNADYRAFNPVAHGFSFFPSKKLLNGGFLVCVEHKPLLPVSASTHPPLSLNSDMDLEEAETKTQQTYKSTTVRVKFHLKKECSFGEQFALVGNDQMLGMWNPDNAIPLNWSEGHVWTLKLDIPTGKSIQFKFIQKEITGKILWQPGPDRILKTWETENIIVVSEDWEDATFQQLIEEEFIADRKKEPTEEEAPLVIVADKITYTKEDPLVGAIVQILSGQEINPENEANSNKEAMIAEEGVENTGRAPADMNLASMNVEGNLVTDEGDPVLVPGLPPLSESSSHPVTHDEGEIISSFDASDGIDEVEITV